MKKAEPFVCKCDKNQNKNHFSESGMKKQTRNAGDARRGLTMGTCNFRWLHFGPVKVPPMTVFPGFSGQMFSVLLGFMSESHLVRFGISWSSTARRSPTGSCVGWRRLPVLGGLSPFVFGVFF